MKKLVQLLMILGFLATVAQAQCEKCGTEVAEHKHSGTTTIVSVAKDAGVFNTLLAAAEAAGLVETLNGEGPYTVLAPNDDAFAKLGDETIQSLLGDKEKLRMILLYHVVPGKNLAKDVVKAKTLTSAQGGEIAVTVNDSGVMVNNAKVLKTDIMAGNGVIHVIDTVILPE
jgi:uncharacterized surface protein with fasciclin (FAS1) repeats